VKELNDTDSDMGGVQYKTATRDPSGRFELKITRLSNSSSRFVQSFPGWIRVLVYRLSIRNQFQTSASWRWRNHLRHPTKMPRKLCSGHPCCAAAKTMPIKVMAFRRDNFKGDIELKVETSPGRQWSRSQNRKGQKLRDAHVDRCENAAGWVGPIKIVGKS